jgi:zinc and cadmium transporter
MCAIALVGGFTLWLKPATLERIKIPLIAFSAGSLVGGAFFHMLPASITALGNGLAPYAWLALGFTLFFALEQLLHWHHCQRAEADCRKPLTVLILIGDGLHNFLGGMAIAGTFLIDIRLGILSWLAAAAHELPQELGDFAVLTHGGWKPKRALAFNFLSASTFLMGGLLAYAVSNEIDVAFLVPMAAGNFLYIGAADLIPEINKHSDSKRNWTHFLAFSTGILLMLATRLIGPS